MGLIDRVTQLLRPAPVPAGGKQAAAPAQKTSGAGPMIAWSNIGQPVWTPRRFENLAQEGFRKNVIAYRCAMQIATAASAIPWLLYDDLGNEIDRHPLLDLLRHPNPMQDGVTFLESVYAFLEIAGNVFIEAVRPSDDGRPVELYVLRPDRMKIIPGPAGLPQGFPQAAGGCDGRAFYSNGVTSTNTGNAGLGNVNKVATRNTANSASVALNGVLTTTVGAQNLPTQANGITHIGIGNNGSGNGPGPLNGYISRITLWDREITDGQMIEWTR